MRNALRRLGVEGKRYGNRAGEGGTDMGASRRGGFDGFSL
jgi:hypothetical protein